MPQTCKSCQESVEEGMNFCPACGADLAEDVADEPIEWPPRMPKRHTVFWQVLGALVVWTVLMIILLIAETLAEV